MRSLLSTLGLLTLAAGLALARTNAIEPNVTFSVSRFQRNATNFYIGGLFDITSSSGLFLERGVDRAEAFVCAIERINAMTTLLPNITLGYTAYDSATNPNTALFKSLTFIGTDYLGVVGKSVGLLNTLFNPSNRTHDLWPGRPHLATLLVLSHSRRLLYGFFGHSVGPTREPFLFSHVPGRRRSNPCHVWALS